MLDKIAAIQVNLYRATLLLLEYKPLASQAVRLAGKLAASVKPTQIERSKQSYITSPLNVVVVVASASGLQLTLLALIVEVNYS